MAEDSSWFRTAIHSRETGFLRDGSDWVYERQKYVPLFEAKMFHQFDHRWATYDGADTRDSTEAEKKNPEFEPMPRYWVPSEEVANRLADQGWAKKWLIGWRDVTSAHVLRTVIATVLPRTAVGHKAPLVFPAVGAEEDAVLLIAILSSLVVDYCARQKVGGTSLTVSILNPQPSPHFQANASACAKALF
jgi:hypothetical protein